MITLETARRRPAVDRRADRLVAVTGITLAIGFLLLALLSTFLPSADRSGVAAVLSGMRNPRSASP